MLSPRTLLSTRPIFFIRQKDHSQARHRSGLRTLTLFGGGLVICYLLYFLILQSHVLWQSPTLIPDRWKEIFYPIQQIFPAQWIRVPRTSDSGYIAVVLFVALLGVTFALYLLAMRFAARAGAFSEAEGSRAFRRILLVTVVVLILLMFVPGVLSADLFSYVWYGRIAAFYGTNPLTHVPADYTWHDPGGWLQWVYWKETPSVYGPVWVGLAWLIGAVSQALGGDIVNHIVGHKLLASLSHLVGTALVWHISGVLLAKQVPGEAEENRQSPSNRHVGLRIATTLAFAWNPLLLLEFGANGHNDALMVTGVLSAILLHLKGRWRLAVLALGLAMLVKFIAIVFVPGYLWLLYWEGQDGVHPLRRLRRPVQAFGILAAAMVIAYIPIWEGFNSLKPIAGGPPTALYVNSLGWLMRFKLSEGIANFASLLGWKSVDFWSANAVGNRLDWPVRWGAYLITAAVAAIQTWRARTIGSALTAWGWILFTYLAIGAVWFWPWYVAWLLGVSLIAPSRRLYWASIILSASSLLLYATYWRSSPVIAELETWKPLLMFAPPLLYLMVSAFLERRSDRRVRRTHASYLSPEPYVHRHDEHSPGWNMDAAT